MEVGWPIGGSLLTSNERPFCYKIWKQRKLPITKKKSSILVAILSFVFYSIGVLLIPIPLKVVGPLLLDSNSSRDGTNPPSNSLYGNPQTRKQKTNTLPFHLFFFGYWFSCKFVWFLVFFHFIQITCFFFFLTFFQKSRKFSKIFSSKFEVTNSQ